MNKEQTSNTQAADAAEARIESARQFLCAYQLCIDMLDLRKYERKRARGFDEEYSCEEILMGNEAYWRARMFEVSTLINSMKNGREKLILYYRYIRGESVEHIANCLGVSRRTGYRMHKKALLSASYLLDRQKNGFC